MAATALVVQDDFFGASRPLGRVPAEPSAAPRPAQRKRMAETTHAAGKARPESKRNRDQRRIMAAIVAAGAAGCTRQELADQLHHPGIEGEQMPIQTVCWAVDALLKAGAIEEPIIDRDPKFGRAIHLTRDRKKVLVAITPITEERSHA